MKLHDVAITPDCLRLIGVGPLLESPTGLQPSKSRAEKRLVGQYALSTAYIIWANVLQVYNMEMKQIEKYG
jgi:hypothetical protein